MKVTLERSALMKALGHVQNVVERRNTIPILSNVLLSAEGDQVNLVATDLDIEMSESTGADVGQPGQITAPAHTLYDIVRKLSDGAQVVLQINSDERLDVDSGRAHFTLPLLPSGDFPKMTAEGFTHEFVMAASDLQRLIDKTRFAISTEETRYYLNGIYIHANAGKLRAVATDGHRLALAETDLPAGAEDLPGVIIPRKAVAEIRRLIDGADGNVAMSVSEAKIRFTTGTAVLTSKLIDGSFPDYERVIPKNNPKELVIDNKVFADAVDRVSTISAEKSRSIKMSLSEDNLELTVNNPESGNANEALAVSYSEDPLEIGFNAKYLLDVTGQIEGRDATFYLDSSASPALVKDSEDPDALFVLMPLRV
ncbi:DNA polymerase III beta subunit [Litorimonas taeanensis]|uniref:Beta sliding clamp n=1 Tax=Litorimonas taeanensis TaxID=568099 RepID=A0A420WEQ5_9PROT|nr:DNA polymerase III subunit beta [Litorimonas taeanensis]RKQ69459.1 DNA polymerase III beta subunit [Litorimonas taeanensis]